MKNMMSTREKQFVYRSSPPLRRLRLRWGSHKGRSITKSHLPHPIHNKGGPMLTNKLHKGGEIQTFPGAPDGKGIQRTMPNHPTSFKSNKCESKNQSRHKCFLRWMSDELSQGGLISHLKSLSHPNPKWNLAWDGLERGWERGNGAQTGV
jgi:hypothetical protein